MAKIRDDLAGTVLALDEHSQPVWLKAGDRIPAGVTVDDHVLELSSALKADIKSAAQSSPTPDDVQKVQTTAPVKPGKTASRDVWFDYASGLGLSIDEDANKAQILEAVEANEA